MRAFLLDILSAVSSRFRSTDYESGRLNAVSRQVFEKSSVKVTKIDVPDTFLWIISFDENVFQKAETAQNEA